jgi:hypothetical protein
MEVLKNHLPEILTAKDIANHLKISRKRVYELFVLKPEYGGIPNIAIGASKRVRREKFLEWLKRKEEEQ